MKKIYILLFSLVLTIAACTSNLYAQTYYDADADTVLVFESPRELVISDDIRQIKPNTFGIELMFSGSGFGLGIQFDRILSSNYKLNYGLSFSGKRNTDEIEYWSYDYNDYIVPNKINRIFIIPVNIGLQRYIKINGLENSFRPFASLSAIPMGVWVMRYRADFFNEIKDSKFHFKAGGGVAVGADFGDVNAALISFKIKYLYVPWGGDGIESIRDFPIKNLGGIFLSLTLGGLF